MMSRVIHFPFGRTFPNAETAFHTTGLAARGDYGRWMLIHGRAERTGRSGCQSTCHGHSLWRRPAPATRCLCPGETGRPVSRSAVLLRRRMEQRYAGGLSVCGGMPWRRVRHQRGNHRVAVATIPSRCIRRCAIRNFWIGLRPSCRVDDRFNAARSWRRSGALDLRGWATARGALYRSDAGTRSSLARENS